jgi:hypothetical protein
VLSRRRVLPNNVNHLSTILDRRSRCLTALAFRTLLRLRALTHQLRFRDRVVPLPRERLWGRLRQRRQTLDRIRVPMIGSLYSVRVDQPSIRLVAIAIESHGSTYQLVPHPSRLKVLGPTDPNLLVIPHRKLGAQQPLPCAAFSANVNAKVSSLSNAPSAPHKNHLLSAMSASTSPC